jgi:hypothetical protein
MVMITMGLREEHPARTEAAFTSHRWPVANCLMRSIGKPLSNTKAKQVARPFLVLVNPTLLGKK